MWTGPHEQTVTEKGSGTPAWPGARSLLLCRASPAHPAWLLPRREAAFDSASPVLPHRPIPDPSQMPRASPLVGPQLELTEDGPAR